MAYQVQQPARNDSVAVSTASVIILEPQSGTEPRTAFALRNISSAAASVITIFFGMTAAVANKSIVLNKGEIWQEYSEAGNPCYQGTVTAICADANGTLAIFER